MYKRRPDLAPVPIPVFLSYEVVEEHVVERARGPVTAAVFSHIENTEVTHVRSGSLPKAIFLAPPGTGSTPEDVSGSATDRAERQPGGGRQHRKRRRGA